MKKHILLLFLTFTLSLHGRAYAVIEAGRLDSLPKSEVVLQSLDLLGASGAALVSVEGGYIMVGGVVDGQLSDRVVRLVEGSETSLPAFPYPLTRAGAALLSGHLFVLGGIQSEGDVAPTNALHSLDLDDPSLGWVTHPALPAAGRMDAALHSFNGELHVFGGHDGAVGSVISTLLLKNMTDVHWVFYAPAATTACIIIGYFVSLLLPGSREKDLTGLTVFDPEPSVKGE